METLDDLIIHVAIPVIMLLLGWIMKQNRDSRIDMRIAIDKLSTATEEGQQALQQYRETWMDRREATLDLMLAQCSQRQTACATIQETKMKQLDDKTTAACKKIEHTQHQFALQWEKQHKINEAFNIHNNEAKVRWRRIDAHINDMKAHLKDKAVHNTN